MPRVAHWLVHSARVFVALLVAVAPLMGCDGDEQASLVSPAYTEPCRYFAVGSCSGNGECLPDAQGEPACQCAVGYAGVSCDACDVDFHRDARDRCVTDRSCAELVGNPCGSYGVCQNQDGVAACGCDRGYGGPRCTLCASGYARSEDNLCKPDLRDGRSAARSNAEVESEPSGPRVPDASCSTLSCPEHATCSDDATCQCKQGWSGTACSACTATRTVSVSFEEGSGWPVVSNTCNAQIGLDSSQLSLRSRAGSSATYVWLCAKNTTLSPGMSTRHVEVEAGPGQTAQLIFPRPITSLRFESASSLIPLSIELVVDSASILDVDAAPGVNAVVSASFSVPTSTVTLRSRTAYAQNVGIDNLAYDFARCE